MVRCIKKMNIYYSTYIISGDWPEGLYRAALTALKAIRQVCYFYF